jgi:hypothetical protein
MGVATEVLDVPGLVRCENTGRDEILAKIYSMTTPVYSAEEIDGRFCTIQEHISCPVAEVYDYLTDVHHLDEWTLSTRSFTPTGTEGLFVGRDTLADDTTIHVRVDADPRARTVDYHAAWDQGRHLWMVYLIRLVDAEVVLGRPGTVLIWTNCRHPNYDHNPYPETVPHPDRPWVGDLWPMFRAAHLLELRNLKAILEHRHGMARESGR